MAGTLRIEVNRARCMAAKSCVNAAAEVFELDATRVSTVRNPAGAPLSAILEAAEQCPTGAIAVFEGDRKLA